MAKIRTIKEQLQRNTVAIISLAVAVTSLGYNTWRNEASEHNRNQRLVSIELLLMLVDELSPCRIAKTPLPIGQQ